MPGTKEQDAPKALIGKPAVEGSEDLLLQQRPKPVPAQAPAKGKGQCRAESGPGDRQCQALRDPEQGSGGHIEHRLREEGERGEREDNDEGGRRPDLGGCGGEPLRKEPLRTPQNPSRGLRGECERDTFAYKLPTSRSVRRLRRREERRRATAAPAPMGNVS